MYIYSIFFRSLYILTFLLISATATAQGKLELKTEVLGLAFDTRAEASLEYLLGERVGIEAGVGYDWDNGIRQSMDGKGRAIDNIFIERFWRSYKYEYLT